MEFISIFNNRELSIGIWLTLLFIWTFSKQPSFYKTVAKLLVSFLRAWKIFLPMTAYILFSIYILYRFNIWNSNHIKITIFWFFGSAIAVLFKSTGFKNSKVYVKEIFINLLSLAVLVSFISNFYSFSLFTELILTPFVSILVGISTLANYNPKHKVAGKFTNIILIGIGLIIFIISLYKTVLNFDDFATVNTFLEFILPILLSVMLIPFAYMFLAFIKVLVWLR